MNKKVVSFVLILVILFFAINYFNKTNTGNNNNSGINIKTNTGNNNNSGINIKTNTGNSSKSGAIIIDNSKRKFIKGNEESLNISFSGRYVSWEYDKSKSKGTLSQEEFRDFCKTARNNIFCNNIKNGFYYDNFYPICSAIKKDNIKNCENIKDARAKEQCNVDYYLNKVIKGKNKDICNVFNTDLKNTRDISQKSNNYDFCVGLSDLANNYKKGSKKEVDSFISKYFGESELAQKKVEGIINTDPSKCIKNIGIKDRLECYIFINKLNCDKLKDSSYIFALINGTSYFSSFQSLGGSKNN